MSILHQIVAHKREEVKNRKQLIPVSYWKESPLYGRTTLSMGQRLREGTEGGIIAEFKRRSPSRPSINMESTVTQVAQGYEAAGVAGMSVLTDSHYFGGSLDDLVQARASCGLPLLRKDFVTDPYQVHESRAHGADVVLLIAAVLEPGEVEELAGLANELGLEILLEVHTLEELQAHRAAAVTMIGVNNRNLKTFEVSLKTSIDLIGEIPKTVLPVSESGLKETRDIEVLREAGYRGFLMGEQFMKSENPGHSAAGLIRSLHPNATSL